MEDDKIVDYEIDLNDIDTSVWFSATSDQMNMASNITAGAQGSAIPSGSYTINTSQFNGTSANYYYTNANPTISVSAGPTPSLDVSGDANFSGDIKWKGRSLGDMLETIESRLAILTPDPAKLEHFEALQKAYQHYKTLEALCQVPKKETK